ncbi:hypothetical protein BDR04DRAFT_1234022 [Suillus decipiens]|nr:hypothetical protein BDR04DRAFT_1234022 [Suillus decipiens]
MRTRVMECLENIQLEATMMDSAPRGSSAHLQTMFDDENQNIATVAPDELNTILPLSTTLDLSGLSRPLAHGRLSDQKYGLLESVGVMGSLLEDTGPTIRQHSLDVLLCDTSDGVSYELGVQQPV